MMCFLIKFYKIWDEKQHKHLTWAFDATTHNSDKHQQDKAIVTIVDPSFILLMCHFTLIVMLLILYINVD
jgi:hypothetical protein